jgi:hypothetical protein
MHLSLATRSLFALLLVAGTLAGSLRGNNNHQLRALEEAAAPVQQAAPEAKDGVLAAEPVAIESSKGESKAGC